ncbi:hypothetical protein B0H11DRAFT_1939455 [Mycena galericulata]|nr:hypothetical protein B0H11DRAFT_1939455 [Mycena galericulata]
MHPLLMHHFVRLLTGPRSLTHRVNQPEFWILSGPTYVACSDHPENFDSQELQIFRETDPMGRMKKYSALFRAFYSMAKKAKTPGIGYKHYADIDVDTIPTYRPAEEIPEKANALWTLLCCITLIEFLEPHVAGDGVKFKPAVINKATERNLDSHRKSSIPTGRIFLGATQWASRRAQAPRSGPQRKGNAAKRQCSEKAPHQRKGQHSEGEGVWGKPFPQRTGKCDM